MFAQAPQVCMPLIIVSDLALDHVTALNIYIYNFCFVLVLFICLFIWLGWVRGPCLHVYITGTYLPYGTKNLIPTSPAL